MSGWPMAPATAMTDRADGEAAGYVAGQPPTLVSGVESCAVEDWDTEFARARQATFFHSPLWSCIWQEHSRGRYRPAPLRVTFTDGRSALLARTVERTRYGVVRWLFSPAWTYGGWLAAEPLQKQHEHALTEIIRRARSVVWIGSPDQVGICRLPSTLGTTHVIDLASGAEAARAAWRPTARNKVRRAQRVGVRVREAHVWNDWVAYFASYRATMKLWTSPTSRYDLPFFRLLWEARSPSVRLWLAEQHGSVIGGALVFTHGDAADWWHAAQAPRVQGTANLLQWEIMAALEADGISTYNLGSSGRHKGVAEFKETLGADAVQFPVVIRKPLLERTVGLVRYVDRLRKTS